MKNSAFMHDKTDNCTQLIIPDVKSLGQGDCLVVPQIFRGLSLYTGPRKRMIIEPVKLLGHWSIWENMGIFFNETNSLSTPEFCVRVTRDHQQRFHFWVPCLPPLWLHNNLINLVKKSGPRTFSCGFPDLEKPATPVNHTLRDHDKSHDEGQAAKLALWIMGPQLNLRSLTTAKQTHAASPKTRDRTVG